MPPARQILDAAAALANGYRDVAIAWHAALALGLALLPAAPRHLPIQLAAVLLVFPLTSVSALALVAGNSFNAIAFAMLAIVLAVLVTVVPKGRVRFGRPAHLVAGSLLVAFGWVYPHFLSDASWTTYLYAAPFGVIPCPTLSAVIGLVLILDRLESRGFSLALAAAGTYYGAVGVLRLGVMIDVVLLAGALVLGAAALAGPTARAKAATAVHLTS